MYHDHHYNDKDTVLDVETHTRPMRFNYETKNKRHISQASSRMLEARNYDNIRPPSSHSIRSHENVWKSSTSAELCGHLPRRVNAYAPSPSCDEHGRLFRARKERWIALQGICCVEEEGGAIFSTQHVFLMQIQSRKRAGQLIDCVNGDS